MTRLLLAALLLTLVVGAVACNSATEEAQTVEDSGTPVIIERLSDRDSEAAAGAVAEVTSELASDATPETEASGATLVARLPATATPTQPPDPLSVTTSDVLPGIAVPLGAELLKHAMATDSTDASADYVVAGIDNDTLFEWFREHMSELGWVEDEERDGALIFLHEEQLSARYADEEEPRTATVFFGTVDGLPEDAGSFTIIAESPYDSDGADAEESDEAAEAAGEGEDEDDGEDNEEEASSDEG